jgi:hypothetical protein
MEYLEDLLDSFSISGSIAEIGTFEGEGSTKVLTKHVLENGGDFTAIDLFTDDDIYNKVKKDLKYPNTDIVKGYSVETGRAWNKKLDFLFIDGDHKFQHISPDGRQTGVALDILAWHQHININGILAFHDYTGTREEYGNPELLGVEHAVDSLCNMPEYKFIGRQGTIVAFQKLADNLLYPKIKHKRVPVQCRPVWKELTERFGDVPRIIIYGTAGSGKYVYDAIHINFSHVPEIIFTDSFTKKESRLYDNAAVIPFEDAFNLDGIIVIGSLFEDRIIELLNENNKTHMSDYFRMFEFVGWCYLSRICIS